MILLASKWSFFKSSEDLYNHYFYNIISFVFADETYQNDTPESIVVNDNWYWSSSPSPENWSKIHGVLLRPDSQWAEAVWLFPQRPVLHDKEVNSY